jgi:hypothetical protein
MPKPAPDSASIANEIEHSLARILDRLASTVRIDRQFSEGATLCDKRDATSPSPNL